MALSNEIKESIKLLEEFDQEFPGAFKPAFLHWIKIFKPGAVKHGKDSWLQPNCLKMDRQSNHDSIFHHLAQSLNEGPKSFDEDMATNHNTYTHPLMHVIWRASTGYYRDQAGIIHEKDKQAAYCQCRICTNYRTNLKIGGTNNEDDGA